MKFRILVAIFNVVIVASFVLIFLMPVFVLGWGYTSLFWRENWAIGIAFLAILASLNAYFAYNWKVFSLLEREDWPGIIAYLEHQFFEKKRVGSQRLKMLVNAYVLSGEIQKITRLESFLRDHKASLVPRFALELGIPYLLNKDAQGMEAFYGGIKDNPRCSNPLWVQWNYAFALVLQEHPDQAIGVFRAVLTESRDPAQRLLTAYFLDAYTGAGGDPDRDVEAVRSELSGKYTEARWAQYIERQRQNIQVLLLTRLIADAVQWAGIGRVAE